MTIKTNKKGKLKKYPLPLKIKIPPLRRNEMARPDRIGPHRVAFDKNKKKIFKTQNVCGICGKPVDMKLKHPHPMSPVIDHIIPINKGGHPSDIKNLQLAHWTCNRQKSDKLFNKASAPKTVIGNRNLPQTVDWQNYKFSD